MCDGLGVAGLRGHLPLFRYTYNRASLSGLQGGRHRDSSMVTIASRLWVIDGWSIGIL